MDFIIENFLGMIAIVLMITSLALQIKFIRFKKKSYPATAVITESIHRKFFSVFKLKMLVNKQDQYVTIFKFKANIEVGSEVEVMYNPYLLNEEDQSIVFSKVLKKLNLYYFGDPIIYFRNQNPLYFYSALLFIGFLIALAM